MSQIVYNALPAGTEIRSKEYTYVIERVLGAGGFGITYLATATVRVGNVTVDVRFAVKEHFLGSLCERDSTTSRVVYSNPVKAEVENSRKDFVSEAQRLHKVGVDHSNIVKVNEVFEANNTAYYVMEYIDGESLRSYVKRNGPLSDDETRLLMEPVVDAVTYLHANRMTHLDIKPDNIMLSREKDGSLRPVLIDFGLSKHYGTDGRPTSTINTLGCSDGYAPIEQYAGITTFTPQADIYALGATMLFCITGRDPKKSTEFPLNSVPELSQSLIAGEIRAAMPMDLSQRRMPFGGTRTVSYSGGSVTRPVVRDVADSGASGINDNATRSITSVKTAKDKMNKAVTIAIVSVLCLFVVIIAWSVVSSREDDSMRADNTVVADVESLMPDTVELPAVETVRYEPVSNLENFALACESDGKRYYLSRSEWDNVPDKEDYKKLGIVVMGNGYRMAVEMEDCMDGIVDWGYAVSKFGNRLPDKAQGEVIAANMDAIQNALEYFGGKRMAGWYWTKESNRDGENQAWEIMSNYNCIDSAEKTDMRSVRGVVVL